MTDLEPELDTKHIFCLLKGANEREMTAGHEIQVSSVKDSFQINHFPLIIPSNKPLPSEWGDKTCHFKQRTSVNSWKCTAISKPAFRTVVVSYCMSTAKRNKQSRGGRLCESHSPPVRENTHHSVSSQNHNTISATWMSDEETSVKLSPTLIK